MSEARRRQIELLREQFSAAASRYPMVRFVWMNWPEHTEEKNEYYLPRELRKRYGLRIDQTTKQQDVIKVFPQGEDGPNQRIIDGRASRWYATRNFGVDVTYGFGPEYLDQNEQSCCVHLLGSLTEMADRLLAEHVLAGELLQQARGKKGGTRNESKKLFADHLIQFGIPEGVMKFVGQTRWLLALRFLTSEAQLCYFGRNGEKTGLAWHISDVFIASAIAVTQLIVPDVAQNAVTVPRVDLRRFVRVDLSRTRIWLGETAFTVTLNQAIVFDALVQADGEFVALKNIDSTIRARDFKPPFLAPELSAVLEIVRGIGLRIPRDKLWFC